MSFERKPGYGGLFIHRNKDGSPLKEGSPQMKGYLKLEDGREIRLAAWSRTGQNSGKWLSLSIDNYEEEEKPEDAVPF